MKSLLLIVYTLLATFGVHAQWQPNSPSQTGSIYYNGGNVGIGKSPGFKLDVETAANYEGIQLHHSNGKWFRIFSSLGGGGFNGITAPNDFGIIFGTDGGLNTVESGLVIAPHVSSASGLRIAANGNVGIGTNQATEKLVVDGNLKFNQSSQKIYWDWPNRTIEQYSPDGNSVMIRFRNSMGSAQGNMYGGFDFADYLGNSVLRINSGNVGIGTSAPNLKLQVATSASLDGFGLQHNNGAWTNFFSPSMTGGAYNGITQAGDAGLIFGNHAGINTVSNGFVIAPHRNTTSGLRITKEGNVGIGTANPNQLLTVNGTIYGKEVKVDLQVPGPDYVFERDYDLPSLEEVQTYITENKHLPEIPSAKEMEANGINLSEMNMLLLKKIEELTLYQIEANKKIEMLQKQVETLTSKK